MRLEARGSIKIAHSWLSVFEASIPWELCCAADGVLKVCDFFQ